MSEGESEKGSKEGKAMPHHHKLIREKSKEVNLLKYMLLFDACTFLKDDKLELEKIEFETESHKIDLLNYANKIQNSTYISLIPFPFNKLSLIYNL